MPCRRRILHLLRNGATPASAKTVIAQQAREHDVMVIDLSKRDVDYGYLVDEIFAHDQVVCWS